MLICQQTHKSHRNYRPITVRLLFIHKTIGYVQQTNQEREKAFSYPFRTHLAITISAMVSGHLGAMSRMEVFLHQA